MANGITVRQSVDFIANDAPALAALRNAYRKMQALSGTDNRSWIYWAGQHGFPNFQCWHHGRVGFSGNRPYNLFLPWHRAYVLYWEHAMRDQDANAALPWWDWTSSTSHASGIPGIFATPQADGAGNPLFDGPVPPMNGDPARRTRRFPLDPSNLPAQADVERVLALSSFVDFQDQLEDIHDAIHGWTGGRDPASPNRGGDMGSVATAAFDPIFWSHHCMIDRIWYLWQLRHGVTNIPPSYLPRPLAPFALTVQGVLDINRLGYEYAQGALVSVDGN